MLTDSVGEGLGTLCEIGFRGTIYCSPKVLYMFVNVYIILHIYIYIYIYMCMHNVCR